MGANVSIPGGIIFGGSTLWGYQGRDGCFYAVYTGEGGTTPYFSGQAFRIKPDGSKEWLQLNPMPRRDVGITVCLEPDGAYVHWMNQDERSYSRAKLPGFEPRDYDGSKQALVPPVALPVSPPTQINAVDPEGRKYTSDTKKALEKQIAALQAQLNALKAPQGGLSEGQVKDIVWSLTPDRMFAELQNSQSGVHGLVAAMIAQRLAAAPALATPPAPSPGTAVTQEQITAMVRQALRTIFAA